MKINEVVVQFYELQCEIQFTVEKMNSPRVQAVGLGAKIKKKSALSFLKQKAQKSNKIVWRKKKWSDHKRDGGPSHFSGDKLISRCTWKHYKPEYVDIIAEFLFENHLLKWNHTCRLLFFIKFNNEPLFLNERSLNFSSTKLWAYFSNTFSRVLKRGINFLKTLSTIFAKVRI